MATPQPTHTWDLEQSCCCSCASPPPPLPPPPVRLPAQEVVVFALEWGLCLGGCVGEWDDMTGSEDGMGVEAGVGGRGSI